MSINVTWYDDKRLILLYKFSDDWSAEQLADAFAHAVTLTANIPLDRRIYAIMDLCQSGRLMTADPAKFFKAFIRDSGRDIITIGILNDNGLRLFVNLLENIHLIKPYEYQLVSDMSAAMHVIEADRKG
jgi:hypothetical protein